MPRIDSPEYFKGGTMSTLFNNKSFRDALSTLSVDQQRRVAAEFVEKVLDLGDERCLDNIVGLFKNPDVGALELSMAYRRAQTIYVETHPGSDLEELDFVHQAKHFVAEACRTCVAPAYENTKVCYLAQKVAMYCRMARTCSAMRHNGEEPDFSQAEKAAKRCVEEQYAVLQNFISEK